jgi:hypothetical protein
VSDISHQPDEPGNSAAVIKPRAQRVWQVGLTTMFLLIAATAVWLTFFINRRQNATLETRINAMIRLAHELVVDDPKRIAVVKLEEDWYDNNRWEIYLPEGRYRLCVATREIDDNGSAPVVKSHAIPSGRHRLALEQRLDEGVWRITVALDGTELPAVLEPKDWDPGFGASTEGRFSVSEQLATDQPAFLFRRRFMREVSKGQRMTPSGPAEGILLWIEKVGEPNAGL